MINGEIGEEYIEGAKGRFVTDQDLDATSNDPGYYKIYSPSSLWLDNGVESEEQLPEDGGKKRASLPSIVRTRIAGING